MELNFITEAVINTPVDHPLVFTTNAISGDTLPDFWGKGFPAMSKKFADILESGGVEHLQKFPAIVKSENDDTIWEDYFAVNILGIIKCAELNVSFIHIRAETRHIHLLFHL